MDTSGEVTRIPQHRALVSAFHNIAAFEEAQRMANALARSDLVPTQFRSNLANCIIAIELSQRIGASPLAVMQNLNIIHGRPSWSAQFVIAALNSCGLFSPLRFKLEGAGADMKCHVEAAELGTGEVLIGPVVSMRMAEAEGWLRDKPTRDGATMVSKWKTMPDMMIRYRSATYFGRLYAPHVLMGMRTAEELIDTDGEQQEQGAVIDATPVTTTEKLNEEIRTEGRRKRSKASDAKDAEPPPPAADANAAPPPAEAGPKAETDAAAGPKGEAGRDFF